MATNPTLTQFPAGEPIYKINFDYLARQFVVLTLVNSADVSRNRELVANIDYQFLNPTTVSVTADQTGFDIMRIHRYTSAERLVDFRDGSTLTASDLTIAELQAIHIAEEGREYTLTLANEAVEKSQDAADRSEDAAQRAEDAAESINNSIVPGGADVIGTRHRGRLNLDLDAIDRRPDGYSNNPATVLANGYDVQINKDIDITGPIVPDDYQFIQGAGGLLKNTTNGTTTGRAISIMGKNGVRVRDVRALGKIVNGDTTGGNVAYCLHAEDCENLDVDGIESTSYTGAVELTRVTNFRIRNIYARRNRYHPNVVAGGYGIVLSAKNGTIDGINFEADASKGDLGRHAIYFSARDTEASGSTEFCENVSASNLIARYNNIDNRNMPAVVIRRSNRCSVENFVIEGSNGGFGFNTDNGVISDFQIRDGHLRVLQPVDNEAVSCIGGGKDNDATQLVGLKVDNVTMDMEGKPGASITTYRTHPINVTGRRCQFSNLRLKVRGDVNPILVGATSNDWIIDGVKDFVTFGSPTAPLIRFQGSNSNIRVFNLDTTRAPFVGLDNVTDLTVNWERFARIVNFSGALTLTDTNSLFSSVSITGAGEITVVFKNHVTTDAVRNCTVTPASVAGLVVLPEITGRNLILRFYNGSGTLVPLSSTIVSADIRLHS